MTEPISLHWVDWSIILAYIVFSLGVGIYFSKRASSNTEEYFLSGRSLPWWVVGTSMVATTFAADTPLAITEFVRGPGIWQNWFWWNLLMGSLLGVFLFSRLWQRAQILTDNELLEIRYSGRPAALLRAFKAGYFSILYNFIVMGWVINAMASVTSVMLNIDKWTAVWICVIIALVYAILSGFWGVVITDMVQFCIAMFGSIALAIIALNYIGGMENLLSKLSGLADISSTNDNTIKFIPPLPKSDLNTITFWESPFSKFLVFIGIMWWSHHGTDGGGYIIQRMSSAKNERHALLATLWFNLAHYALRVWPWIIVALVSIVMFPKIPDSYSELGVKAGYPLVMNTLLGPGIKGILIVSFLAAFMSTIDTHLNWGASYIINDIYKRFYKPHESESHYVMVGKISTVILMALAAFTSLKMQSISKAWEFIFSMGAGIGLVLILRWFWWRINSWTEIAAMVISFLTALYFGFVHTQIGFQSWSPSNTLVVSVAITTAGWLVITMITEPEDNETLINFYRKIRPLGPGWNTIIHQADVKDPGTDNNSELTASLMCWFLGCVLIYSCIFGTGFLIYGDIATGFICMLVAGLSAWGIHKIFPQIGLLS